MATLGHLAALKLTGIATALASEPCTHVTGSNYTQYQITAATKRALDLATAVVVEVDADGGGAGAYADALATDYTVNPITGIVTFAVARPSVATVRIKSGKFLPLLTLAEANSLKLSFSRELLEATTFEDTSGAVVRKAGLVSLEGSVGGFDHGFNDLDATAGNQRLFDLIDLGTLFLIDATFPGGGFVRFFSALESLESSADVDGMLEGSYGLKATAVAVTGRTDSYLYGRTA